MTLIIVFQTYLILKIRDLEVEMKKITGEEEKMFREDLPSLLEEIERDAEEIHTLYLKGQISDSEYKTAHRELLDLLEKVKERYRYKK